MFSSEGLYGFCKDPESEGDEVFFHAQDFHRMEPGGPLPIIGEPVEIENVTNGDGRRPRAGRVLRAQPPKLVTGVIHSFDSDKGWGFVNWDGGQAFFHMSDRAEEWMPVIGSAITFFVGYKSGRPRACWARPARTQATFDGERTT